MLWFLRDYPLAAVVLRAATLAFQSLMIGGVVFCALLLVPGAATRNFRGKALRLMRIAANGLAAAQLCFVATESVMLTRTSELHFADLLSANYFLAGLLTVAACAVFLATISAVKIDSSLRLFFLAPLLFASVWTSHSASRLDDRALLMLLTGLHQLATAVWIGAMPYLWLLLAAQQATEPALLRTVQRYSRAALCSVAVLVVAGVSMAWVYTQAWSAVYGTAYGIVLTAKSVMLVALLLLGGANFFLVRNGRLHMPPILLRIARLSEAEIGIGFTIILAAASLGSQPPAIDLVQDRLSVTEIARRMAPEWPRLHSPALRAMPAVQPIGQAIRAYAAESDELSSANNRTEQAWAEYNHHWAGIVVFLAGLFAVMSRWERTKWARHWPLVFLGLAAFLFLRADPEAWPLGPRGFWASFYNPEDLEHRLFILLVLSFVGFEWRVQTGRIRLQKAALVFPAVCALGGALLLTHDHSAGNVKEELLGEISHTAIALCAVFAGWSRWLEIRLQGRGRRFAAAVWPACLMLIGLVLLNYREG